MFPLRDDNPTRTTPVVTILLIVLNVVGFIYQNLLGLDYSTLMYGLVPAELLQHADITWVDRLPGGTVRIQNLDPAWLTVLTSMFMHGNLLHIVGNMWYLWIFGNNVEDDMGKVPFLVFYLVCGVGAALAQSFLNAGSQTPMVGASGAVAGVLGAYLVLFPGSRVLCLITTFIITITEVPAFLVLGLWFVIQVVSGVGALGMRGQRGGVAFAAHVGGFALGWLIARMLPNRRPPPRRTVYSRDYMDWR